MHCIRMRVNEVRVSDSELVSKLLANVLEAAGGVPSDNLAGLIGKALQDAPGMF